MEFMNIEMQGSVAVVTLNHGPQNQFDTPFMEAITARLTALEDDKQVSAVVVTAAQEKYFCTGLNLEYLFAQGAAGPDATRKFLETLSAMLYKVASFGKPLIAALNGHAVAGGCILAAYMDFRVMRNDKGFVRLPEVEINIPFWPGMTAIFKDIVSDQTFRRMALTGDKFTGPQAKEMGFVDELVSPEQLIPKAVEIAAALGRFESATYAIIKRDMRANVLRIMREEDPGAIEEFMRRMSGK